MRFLFFIAIFFQLTAFSQQATISGTVREAATGEEIIGAIIRVKNKTMGVVTNEYGFYSLTLPLGNYVISVQNYDYKSIEREIKLESNQRIDFQLEAMINETSIDEVIITGERKDQNVKDPIMGVERLDTKEIAKIPVIFGEKDLLKTMQLLPGVKNAGEGSSGFYVRGGGSDQNLVLLDEAPVYNASHLLGFFSTFNSEDRKSVV